DLFSHKNAAVNTRRVVVQSAGVGLVFIHASPPFVMPWAASMARAMRTPASRTATANKKIVNAVIIHRLS
ncbi:hypothetical protein RZS08_20075, partial [Arthrospira platensis SPKY1]|nr:hypothetical protein [Arthrospira platensis SPKY1]